MDWKNADLEPPNHQWVLLVTDSWNISECDTDGIAGDNGQPIQDFMSLRTVVYDRVNGRWQCSTSPDQRVRFRWYAVITLPPELVDEGFKIDEGAGIVLQDAPVRRAEPLAPAKLQAA